MLKAPLIIRMAFAAAMALGGSAAAAVAQTAAPSRGPKRRAAFARTGSGKRYPEQSSRQALRSHRRAQGGPGIVLVDGKYQPKVWP